MEATETVVMVAATARLAPITITRPTIIPLTTTGIVRRIPTTTITMITTIIPTAVQTITIILVVLKRGIRADMPLAKRTVKRSGPVITAGIPPNMTRKRNPNSRVVTMKVTIDSAQG